VFYYRHMSRDACIYSYTESVIVLHLQLQDFQSRWSQDFQFLHIVQTSSEDDSASHPRITGVLTKGRVVNLTTHLDLVQSF
jgi:hypothetical protein